MRKNPSHDDGFINERSVYAQNEFRHEESNELEIEIDRVVKTINATFFHPVLP